MSRHVGLLFVWMVAWTGLSAGYAQVLDKQSQLDAQTFWDNRDWDWYRRSIPFFECPDADITTTYYYRWELLTKHLTYGSPNSGYVFTEFIDRPFWSGTYGAISCPAGHQLYEARWLRTSDIAHDYTRYWFHTPGAQPRNYSTWLADSAWAVHQVHPNDEFLIRLLPDLIQNYEGWEQRHFVPEVGLFWQTGHDDGMEFNINSRQTQDILRGAPSYRPSFNAYMWADATAIARIARLAQLPDVADRFTAKADALRTNLLQRLWDEKRQFFFPAFKNDEHKDGYTIKALSRTYESGPLAGDSHGRELIGYVPWQFGMIAANSPYDVAWNKLMDRDGFYADFGPSTVERNDPMFLLQKTCCWWSGQSWPYATTQTLKAMARVLHESETTEMDADDYVRLLNIYARSHRKDGKPYLAEALHPDTGSFEGHDAYNHSEHYFHSGYCDLIITGLVGLKPSVDNRLQVAPLAPSDWDYFALDDVSYHGHRVSVVWDKSGERYTLGPGLHVLVDGQKIASSATLKPISVNLPPTTKADSTSHARDLRRVNFAVNNDGTYYPRLTASYSNPATPVSKLHDGNYWYVLHPPNRWTSVGSPNESDWIELDLGQIRQIHTVKLYVLDDDGQAGSTVSAPARIHVQVWQDDGWVALSGSDREPSFVTPVGHQPATLTCPPQDIQKLRIVLDHAAGHASGLTEIEVWGDARLPVALPGPPVGNLAYRSPGAEFPQATASHTSRFDDVRFANDGVTNFLPTPNNRWTSYESTSSSDWLEIDFGQPTEFDSAELAVYDDGGGVQAPANYVVEVWDGSKWSQVANSTFRPATPTGGQWNEVRFDRISASKVRFVFQHQGDARSGVSEVLIWKRP